MSVEWVLGVCAAIVAVVTAIGMIVKGVGWILRTLRKVVRLADDLLGEPERPGQPARPGLMARIASIEGQMLDQAQRMRRVEAQVYPNGGGSLHDKITRVAGVVAPDQRE